MRSGSIVTLAMLGGLVFAGPSDGRAELGGCPPPQEMASALRRMNFPGADWRALTPEKIRGGWQELLNQVECPERAAGIYVLSSFGRIINDESQCSTSLTIGFDTLKRREWLSKVTIFHTSAAFRDARAAGDLLYSAWHPPAGVKTEEQGEDEWRRTLRRPAKAATVSRWPARLGGCATYFQLEREIYRSSSGWTVRISLAPDSVCEAP